MTRISAELVGSYKDGRDVAAHSLLGLRALMAELADQGVGADAALRGTGIAPGQMDDPALRISPNQKIALFGNAGRLAQRPDLGLRAGARQRLSDFGVFGYALASSASFGEALALGMKHLKLAGPVLEKRFRLSGDTALFEGRDVLALGPVLPLATEFWLSSILKLISCVIETPFPSRRLLLPYARPAHAAAYERMFGCPAQFDAGVLQWQFDAAVLQAPCPEANPITAALCSQFCERLLDSLPQESALARSVRNACLGSRGNFPSAREMAGRLGLSVRTLHRRLTEEGQHYQGIVDEVRSALAIEFLRNTTLSVEEVACRVGFTESSNFRKAFRRWTGQSPARFRAPQGQAPAAAARAPTH
jgi:AraC-like DNA-binding protein